MFQQFRQIKAVIAPSRHILFGQPVNRRPGMHVGAATGVAVSVIKPFFVQDMSSFRGPFYDAGRYMICRVFLPTHHSFVIVNVYAYAGGNKEATSANKALFREICSHISSLPNEPCILCGDFNVDISKVDWIQPLICQGWTNAHSLSFEPNASTYYGRDDRKSCIDYVFLNPFAMRHFVYARRDAPVPHGHVPLYVSFTLDSQISLVKPVHCFSKLHVNEKQIHLLSRNPQWHSFQQAKNTLDINEAWVDWTERSTFGLKSLCKVHKIPTPRIFIRGSHHFQLKSISTDLKRKTVSDTFPVSTTKISVLIATQVRRIQEIVHAIQTKQYWLAKNIFKALQRGLDQPISFQQWFERNIKTPWPVFELYADTQPWVFIISKLESWIKRQQRAEKKISTKAFQSSLMEDWSKGGSKTFASIKAERVSAFFGSFLDVAVLAPLRLRIHTKSTPCITFPRFDSEHPLLYRVQNKFVTPVKVTDKHLIFSVDQVPPDTHIQVCIPSSNGTTLATAFAETWKKVWTRDPNNSIENTLHPRIQHQVGELSVVITMQEWFQVIQDTFFCTAAGVDGWNITDLKCLSFEMHSQAVFLLNEMTTKGICWPQSFKTAIVTAIPKKDKPQALLDFRPISVYPLMYRLWTKVLFKKFISWFVKWTHPSIKGFLPGRSVQQITMHTAMLVEEAMHKNVPLFGATVDIYKCFDCLDWGLVFSLAADAGLPASLIMVWKDFVTTQTRVFKLNDSYSTGVQATRGVGQGDGLSIIAILLLDQWFATEFSRVFPDVKLFIYADNVSFITKSSADLFQAFDFTINFFAKCSLHIDLEKAFCWSSTSQGRKDIALNIPDIYRSVNIVDTLQDLGTRLCFTRKFVSLTISKRCDEANSRLLRLAEKKYPFQVKQRLIAQAILPAVLYLPELHKVSKQRIHDLEVNIAAALTLGAKCRSLQAAMAIAGESCSPAFVVHFGRIMAMKNFVQVMPDLQYMVCVDSKQQQGPVTLFHESLAFFDFVMDSDLIITTSAGFSFHFISAIRQVILFHCRLHMSNKLAEHFKDDRGHAITEGIDIRSTTQSWAHMTNQDQALARRIATLANSTGQAVKHWKPEVEFCKQCGLKDTWEHQVADCVYTQTSLPHTRQVRILEHSKFFKLHGWFSFCPNYMLLLNYLHTLQWHKPTIQYTDTVVLFTDGSATPSTVPHLRLASGAFFNPIDFSSHSFIVPGFVQSSIRAELYALLAALQASNSAVIYCDCSYVVRTFRELQQNPEKRFSSHSDIWTLVKHEILHKGPFQVRKVKAHSFHKAGSTETVANSWANHIVDNIAKIANFSRPRNILDTWFAAIDHCKFHSRYCSMFIRHRHNAFRLFKDLDKQVVASTQELIEDLVVPIPQTDIQHVVPAIFRRVVLPSFEELFPSFLYGPGYGCRLIKYLSLLEWPVNDSAKQSCVIFPLGNLLLDFIFATRTVPPRRIQAGVTRAHTYFEQNEDITALRGTWSDYQTIFVYSLLCLSKIASFEIIPGIANSGLKGTFLQRGESRINHRAVKHSPKSLLCGPQVSAWKHDVLFRYTNPAVISGHILQIPHGHPHTAFVDNIILPEYPRTYSYKDWNKAQHSKRCTTGVSFSKLGEARFHDV